MRVWPTNMPEKSVPYAALAEWMRQYNSNSARPRLLEFFGFDSPTEMMCSDSPRQLIDYVLDYLDGVDARTHIERRQRIDSLIGDDAKWENPAAMMDPAKS